MMKKTLIKTGLRDYVSPEIQTALSMPLQPIAQSEGFNLTDLTEVEEEW